MIDNIILAFQGIWGHKMRSFLTMLGIIIGIAAIMTIVSTIEGTNEQIKRNLIGSGTNAVNVELYQGDMKYEFYGDDFPVGVPLIDEETKNKIDGIEGVVLSSIYNERNYSDGIYYKSTTYQGKIKGVDKNYFKVTDYYIQYGRDFKDSDFKYKKVAILDKVASKTLFNNENPIGKTIEISSEPFVVVGVVDKNSLFKPVINSIKDYMTYASDSNGEVFIPINSWSIIYAYDEPENIVLKSVDTDSMTKIGHDAAKLLSDRITSTGEEKITYKNNDLLKQAKQLQELGSSTNNQLILIASISLLVGGIGVMNIMLVSVTERTKEIGLKKAIGAKRKVILFQFLTEAAVLTSIGGILGVLLGIGMSELVSRLSGIPVMMSIPATIISVIFSMVIGVIFGLLPAIKASKLNPIDALRSE